LFGDVQDFKDESEIDRNVATKVSGREADEFGMTR